MSDPPPQAPDDSSRATIGPYEIVKVLARGERETVYLGIEPTSEREVAIRVSSDGEPLHADEQTVRDASVARGLVHRNLLRVFDAGQHEGLSYVVEEARRGHTLADILRESLHTLDMPTRLDLVAQLCIGLHFIHEHGLIHGEVKPANVFVTTDGVVKLLNLGVGSAGDMTIVSDNALSGTFEYSSPEQLMSRDDVDGRSDIFSAAVILYELVTGRRPFQGPSTAVTLARIVREDPVPLDNMPEVDAIVRRALEKNPTRRFSSAREFAYALWMVQLSEGQPPDQTPAARSDTIHDEGTDQFESQGTVIENVSEVVPESRQTLIYAGIATAVIAVGAGVLLRTC